MLDIVMLMLCGALVFVPNYYFARAMSGEIFGSLALTVVFALLCFDFGLLIVGMYADFCDKPLIFIVPALVVTVVPAVLGAFLGRRSGHR